MKRLEKHRSVIIAWCSALLLLSVSFVINYYAGTYANESQSNSVTDIVLSNIRIFAVDDIFIYGVVLFALFILFRSLRYPKQMPFIVKSIAVFIIIRSLFISLTHIGPFPTRALLDKTGLLNKMSFGADLFFSGHTGLPFLMALIFWHHRRRFLRYIFFIGSIFFGVIVLLGHYHYTIDVLAAFFIAYAIHDINSFLFAKDKKMFDASVK